MQRGGKNRVHDSVSNYERIDSFKIGTLRGWFIGFWNRGGSVILDCTGDDSVELFCSINEPPDRVGLSRVANHYGGDRAYFLCPECGRRVRFLYRPPAGDTFRCRRCWSLNYPSQQMRSREASAYLRGVKLLRERFKWPESLIPKPKRFYGFFPPRPKWMRRWTYRELCKELELLQGEYYLYFYLRTRELWADVDDDDD